MATKVRIDPVTRIEGHLAIEIEVDGGKVTSARVAGEMFRGFEMLLKGRHPLDAQQITQRICGVCPAGHAMASALTLDSAFGVQSPDNGRIIRNLILGANYVQSHILHFYQLVALDFVDVTALLSYQGADREMNKLKDWASAEVQSGRLGALGPFLPRQEGDYLKDTELNLAALAHYIEALKMRRKAHEALAIWGGKMPHIIAIFPGGVSEHPTVDKIAAYASYMEQLSSFIDNVYIPDVLAVADAFPAYWKIGKGTDNLLSYGVFDQDALGKEKLFRPGAVRGGKLAPLDVDKISEEVGHSRFTAVSSGRPTTADTVPDPHKGGAYSWLKAPRYGGEVCEVGPLARLAVEYLEGKNLRAKQLVDQALTGLALSWNDLFSVLGRHAARALETKIVAEACSRWVLELKPGKPVHNKYQIPAQAQGVGLTEAARGALGHWIRIRDSKIDAYQCVVPTTWNCSPRDDRAAPGAMEQALIGTPIADPNSAIEAMRVVRSFDPCLACAVHVVDAESRKLATRVLP